MGGQQLEVRHLAHPAAGLDLADQLARAGDERPAEAVQQRLHRPPAHGQIAVDARVRLGRAPVEGHEPLQRSVEVVRVEPVERLRPCLRVRQDLARQPEEQRPIAWLRQGVGDRQVRDRGGEQHRPVGLLRPQVAEDVVRDLRAEVAGQRLHARAAAPVQLAHHERAPAGVVDAPGREVVRAEVHERADGPRLAHGLGDQRLVEPVLQRDHAAVAGQPRRDPGQRRARVLVLDRQQHRAQGLRQLVRADRPSRHRELLHRPLQREPVRVDRRHVVRVGVAQQHVMARPQQPRAHRPADRSGADDGEAHAALERREQHVARAHQDRFVGGLRGARVPGTHRLVQD